jgi:hypothetical protein
LERYFAADGEYLGKYGKSNEIRIANAGNVEYVKDYILGELNGPTADNVMKK